jgi:1-acyl-sn-glycerol-3-phosphate acyltransferase
VVGLFAEGQASWDGHTQTIIPSTAKLIKLLKVPVIAAVLKGSFYSQPRWAWNHRPGDIEIEFKLIMDGAEAKARSPEEILAALEDAMEYDEEEWRANHPARHGGSGRAKHLELSLFMCPACGQIGTMRSYVNRLYCRGCGEVARLSRSYKFMAVGSSRPRFSSIREWDRWQKGALSAALEPFLAKPEAPIFSDAGVLILRGRRMSPLRKFRTGTMILFSDRIELATLLGERLVFTIAGIEGQNVIKQQLFEFYHGKTLYQFRFPRRFQSARKWMDAVEALRTRLIPPAR